MTTPRPESSPRLSTCAYLNTSHSLTICLKVSLFLSRFASLLRLQKPCFAHWVEWMSFLNAYPPGNLPATLLHCLFVLPHQCIKSIVTRVGKNLSACEYLADKLLQYFYVPDLLPFHIIYRTALQDSSVCKGLLISSATSCPTQRQLSAQHPPTTHHFEGSGSIHTVGAQGLLLGAPKAVSSPGWTSPGPSSASPHSVTSLPPPTVVASTELPPVYQCLSRTGEPKMDPVA